MSNHLDRIRYSARASAAIDNFFLNMAMKECAKEILREENYIKFMKSYRFTFWYQLLGTIACFIIPCAFFLIVYKEVEYCAIGLTFGVFGMIIWLLSSLIIPPTRIYRKFAKWYQKGDAPLSELDVIFYGKQ